jgi:RNA polymerase sigma-70 factor (ECF subfamily)
VSRHDASAFEQLMRRYNGRLFRVARSILKDDPEAEDAVQDAYLQAYRHIDDFRGDAQLTTWLTRIVVNQALGRLRSKKRDRNVVSIAEGRGDTGRAAHAEIPDDHHEPPPQAAFRAEIRRLIEQKIDDLPDAFRTVFVLRDIEDMTVQETAECLSIPPATVRTRLFRARALLREALAQDLDSATVEVFGFAGARCDRIVAKVLTRIVSASH